MHSLPQDALAAERERALQRYEETGLPHKRTPGWKFTSIKKLSSREFTK